MKKILVSLAVILGLAQILSAADIKQEIQNIPMLKNNNVMVKKVHDMGSLYVVGAEAVTKDGAKQAASFFVTKDKKIVIVGNAFDGATMDAVTMPIDVSGLKGKQAFKIGNGKNEYYVFTDPECPYCKKFEEEIVSKNLTKNNTFYVFLFPLSFHKSAHDMSLFILSKSGDAARWKALQDSQKFTLDGISAAKKTKLEEELAKQEELGRSLDIGGTATVLDKNGKSINWTTLN